MAYTDIMISTPNNNARSSHSNSIITDNGSVLFATMEASDNSLSLSTSFDDALTWGDKSHVKAAQIVGCATWYDKWTPGDTGNVMYLAYIDTTSDDVLFRTYDTSTGLFGTEVVVFAGASVGTTVNTCIAITKAIGGNLYIAFDIDGGTETGFYRSTDGGATWTSRSNVNEAASTDYYLLGPGFAADNQDIICIFWDRSANELSRKLYDNSGDAWAETSIAGSMTAVASNVSTPQFSITVDDANNKILMSAWSNRNTVGAKLRIWSLDESSITEKTNVVSSSLGNQQCCGLTIMPNAGNLLCFYIGDSAGTGPYNVFYKISTDGGTTWGAETRHSSYARVYVYLSVCLVITSTYFYTVFQLDASTVDATYISAVLPSSGGSSVAPILGDFILQ